MLRKYLLASSSRLFMVVNVGTSLLEHSVYGRQMRAQAVPDLECLVGLKKQPLSKDQIRAAVSTHLHISGAWLARIARARPEIASCVQKEAISRLTQDELEHAGLAPPPMPMLTEEVLLLSVSRASLVCWCIGYRAWLAAIAIEHGMASVRLLPAYVPGLQRHQVMNSNESLLS